MRARVVAPGELTGADVAGWTECAASSLEPNPFFEPAWLLAALDHLDESPTTLLVMAEHGHTIHACIPVAEVAADDGGRTGAPTRPTLVTRVAPTAVGLGTPLVVLDRALEALTCAMTELWRTAEERGAGLVVMEWVGSDGPIAPLLREAAARTSHPPVEFASWERGCLRRRTDEDGCYWLEAIGKNRRRTIRQHRRQLDAALGSSPVVHRRTDSAAIQAFLDLEASGWKGHGPEGLALRRQAGTAAFFDAACRRYLDEGRLWFLSLEGDGVPIAMVCCLRGGDGVFAVRTAYDERLARFGPGVEVFLAAMADVVHETDAQWLDTCTGPDNHHLLGLFPDRRAMSTLLFRMRSRPGRPTAVD
jgi:hypothetical protein